MQPLGLSGYDSYMYVSVLIAYQNINICGCNHTKLLMELHSQACTNRQGKVLKKRARRCTLPFSFPRILARRKAIKTGWAD